MFGECVMGGVAQLGSERHWSRDMRIGLWEPGHTLSLCRARPAAGRICGDDGREALSTVKLSPHMGEYCRQHHPDSSQEAEGSRQPGL